MEKESQQGKMLTDECGQCWKTQRCMLNMCMALLKRMLFNAFQIPVSFVTTNEMNRLVINLLMA